MDYGIDCTVWSSVVSNENILITDTIFSENAGTH